MNKTVISFSFLLAFALAATAATEAKDPAAPFNDYGPAMTSTAEKPLTVNWQNAHEAEMAALVSDETLAAIASDEEAARDLLLKLTSAYRTDAAIAIQVAAVSQWVMGEDPCWLCFWKPRPSSARSVWVKALVARAETADDTYVTLFCLDQLRWCGCTCPCIRARIEAIGAKSGDKAVKDMVDIVLRTLK